MMEAAAVRPQTSRVPDAPLRGGALALALLPLFILGLGVSVNAIPLNSELDYILAGSIGFMLPYPVVLIALLVGWLKGFPRWSYPYLAYAFFFALYISFAATPGFSLFGMMMWDREMWGWRAFVPLAVILAIALLSGRAARRALRGMLGDIWHDWSRIAYAIYGLLPLIIPILQDETGREYRLPVTVIASAIMLLGAALYLGLASPRLRDALMLAGAYLCILAASLGSNLYWETHDVDMITFTHRVIEGPIPWSKVIFPSLSGSLFFTLILLLVPALVGLTHWLSNRGHPGSPGAAA